MKKKNQIFKVEGGYVYISLPNLLRDQLNNLEKATPF